MIIIVLGTRPEIIKMAPVIRLCEKKRLDYCVIHTGQHYSYEMDKIFFEELNLPTPEYNLNVGSGTHGEQTARILEGVEGILIKEKCSRSDTILVEGDTNTVLAGALAASKLHIKVGHVEAGLRSYFRDMPEEINRVLTDHMSDYLFAPTKNAKSILVGEGIPEDRIHITGNTIVDSVYQNSKIAKKKSRVLGRLGLKPKGYFLATAHRPENVDSEKRLKDIFKGLRAVHSKYGLPVIFSVHPRTAIKIKEFGIAPGKGISLMTPVGFLDFLELEENARLILTDSGGVQEEACILKVPCVTLRDNTERPETVEVGGNVLSGCDPLAIEEKTAFMLKKKPVWKNPFGNGKAGEKILRALKS